MYKPNTVQIELVQGCNRNCTFCGTSGMEKKVYYIKPEVLRKQCKLVKESGYNPRILLAGHGEPTLHPHFYKCVKLIRKELPKLWIQILTNGYSVNKDLNSIIEMYRSGINDITLDEYSDSKFNDEEIKKVLEEYEKTTGEHVQFVRMGRGVPLYAPKQISKKRLLINSAIEEDEVSLSRKLTNHCGAGMPPDDSCVGKRCTRLFREFVYRWDGNIALCCQDFRGEYFVCNMMDDEIKTFDDMWLHERMESARKITYHDGRKFYPCSICNLIPIRPGLLPDYKGKEDMPKPTKEDYKIVSKKRKPLANIKLREWEE